MARSVGRAGRGKSGCSWVNVGTRAASTGGRPCRTAGSGQRPIHAYKMRGRPPGPLSDDQSPRGSRSFQSEATAVSYLGTIVAGCEHMKSNDPPEAPNVNDVPSQDFSLDDLGYVEVSDEVVQITRLRIREELRRDWSSATHDEIETAATQMEQIQLRALTFGLVNYRMAYEAGAQVVEVLNQARLEHG